MMRFFMLALLLCWSLPAHAQDLFSAMRSAVRAERGQTMSGGVVISGGVTGNVATPVGFSCAGTEIVCDHFEGGDANTTSWSVQSTPDNIVTQNSTLNPYAGAQSLKIEYFKAAGSSSDASLTKIFSQVTSACFEARLLKHRCTSATGPCAGSAITESAAQHDLSKLFRFRNNEGGSLVHEVVMDLEETTSNQVFALVFGDGNHFVSPTTIWGYDAYNSVKVVMILDSAPGNNDGTLKYWYNGTQLLNLTTVRYRNTGVSNVGWDRFWVGSQCQNSTVGCHVYHLWDNVKMVGSDTSGGSTTSCLP